VSRGLSRRVLVVEDDDAIALVIQDLLEGEGFVVLRARDGRVGLALLHTFEPHVIVLDLMMPVLDGWRFRAEQRQLAPALARIPVVILSGARDAATAATDLAAAALVVKPFELDALTAAVRSALN
jgi:two-component system chemotaxis response regulator CheY